MPINDALLPEYDREITHTHRLLERVPDASLAWRPHDRSRTLGQLAAHIAGLPRWATIVFESTIFDLDTARPDASVPPTAAAVVEQFDRHAAAARTALAARTDGEYLARWTLRKDGENVFTLPKAAVIRTMVLNHLIHHRGQLTVYLRLLDVPLPPLYGPTADVP